MSKLEFGVVCARIVCRHTLELTWAVATDQTMIWQVFFLPESA